MSTNLAAAYVNYDFNLNKSQPVSLILCSYKDTKTEKYILVILALADDYRIKDIARILRI